MKYTFTKYTFNIPEIVTYFAYIYSLIALAILIKPTRALYLMGVLTLYYCYLYCTRFL